MGIYDRDYMRRREVPSFLAETGWTIWYYLRTLSIPLTIVAAIAALVGGAIYFSSGSRNIATSEPTAQERARPTPFRTINVNTATEDELLSIPYLTKDTKHAIIEHRPYSTPEELMRVPGIKKRMLERIRPYVTVKQGSHAMRLY